MKRIFNKSYPAIYELKYKNLFQKDLLDFWHKELTLKIEFLQFLKSKKENLFDYKLSMHKYLLCVKSQYGLEESNESVKDGDSSFTGW